MNILIVGNGGREHALAWKLLQSPRIQRIYVAPGNAGTAGHNVDIAANDIPALLAFARENQIDLTVVGPEAPLAAHPETIADAALAEMMAVITANPKLNWSIVKRGFWVNGVDNLRDFLAATLRYTLAGIGREISCPTLVTAAENDFLSKDADRFVAELGDRATLVRFTAAQGAGMHCEMLNRSRYNRTALDWLDATVGSGPTGSSPTRSGPALAG